MADEAAKMQDVLNCLRRHRMTLLSFLEVFFASTMHSATAARGRFFADGGMRRTFQAMLENSDYALGKRQTTKRTKQLYDDFGVYFHTIIVRMLRVEVNEVSTDPLMHMKPIDISPQACEGFSLWDSEQLYKEKAPILFGILQLLGYVPSAIKSIRHVDIGEPLLDEELRDEMEEAEAEVESGDRDGHEMGLQPAPASYDDNSSQRRKRRRPGSKALMSVMCMSLLMTARSLHNNGITGRLGIFRRAMKVPKVMHQFLNTIGFCTAYQTSGEWLRENAASDRLCLGSKFRNVPMGVCSDNLVRFDKKAEPTVLNPGNKIQQNTSAFMFALHIPPPSLDATVAEFVTYRNIQQAIREGDDSSVKGILPAELMFRSVDYNNLTVDTSLFLQKDFIATHIPLIATDLVMDVLGLLCGDAALKSYRLDGNTLLRIPDVSEAADYLVLDPYKSDFHTCPIMGLDETTLDGTGSVYQKLLEYVQVE